MSTAVLGDTLSFVIIIIAFSRHHHHHHVIAMCVCTCCDDGGSVASPGLAQGRLALLSFFCTVVIGVVMANNTIIVALLDSSLLRAVLCSYARSRHTS